jgi:hypothetical protein
MVGWPDQNAAAINPTQVKLNLTHEEIGQMIGTSRETVSRLFAGFKKQHLIHAERLHLGDPRPRGPGIPDHSREQNSRQGPAHPPPAQSPFEEFQIDARVSEAVISVRPASCPDNSLAGS